MGVYEREVPRPCPRPMTLDPSLFEGELQARESTQMVVHPQVIKRSSLTFLGRWFIHMVFCTPSLCHGCENID